MKKLLVVFFVMLVVCVGCVKEEKVTVIDDKVFPEEMEDDLFFEYYLKASKLIDDMTLEEKVAQMDIIRGVEFSTKPHKLYHCAVEIDSEINEDKLKEYRDNKRMEVLLKASIHRAKNRIKIANNQ